MNNDVNYSAHIIVYNGKCAALNNTLHEVIGCGKTTLYKRFATLREKMTLIDKIHYDELPYKMWKSLKNMHTLSENKGLIDIRILNNTYQASETPNRESKLRIWYSVGLHVLANDFSKRLSIHVIGNLIDFATVLDKLNGELTQLSSSELETQKEIEAKLEPIISDAMAQAQVSRMLSEKRLIESRADVNYINMLRAMVENGELNNYQMQEALRQLLKNRLNINIPISSVK